MGPGFQGRPLGLPLWGARWLMAQEGPPEALRTGGHLLPSLLPSCGHCGGGDLDLLAKVGHPLLS